MPQSFEIATSIKTDHRKGITCLCVYDQQSFVTGGNDSLIKLWDLYTFKCSKNLKCETVPYCIITMIDCTEEKLLISGHAQGFVAVFDSEFDLRWVIKKQESVISSIISIDDCRTVFAASYDGTILIIDIIEGKVLKKIIDHEASVNCLAYSKSLKKWASGSDDGRILIWEIQKNKKKLKIGNLKERAPNFFEEDDMMKESLDSIDSNLFVEKEIIREEDEEKNIEPIEKIKNLEKNENKDEKENSLSDSESFKDVSAACVLQNGEEVKHIVFSQNNPRILISTCYNLIKVWDIQTKSCLMKLGKHEKTINRILIFEEKKIKKWGNIPSADARKRADSLNCEMKINYLNNENSLATLMSIDKLMILSFGTDHVIRLWNTAKNKCVCESNDHLKEFSLKDSLENNIIMYNEKDEKPYFLSVGDKDNNINIWKVK